MKILVSNVGSTSFKYRLLNMEDETILAEGRIERIGEDHSPAAHHIGDTEFTTDNKVPSYAAAVKDVITRLTHRESGVLADLSDLDAVGFKTVHLKGEPGTYLLTDEILQRMVDYNDLAPAHNPPYIQAIQIFKDIYPDLPLVGLFEATFHATIPDYAYIYSVPFSWFEEYGIRKYGFHGASHRYVSERTLELVEQSENQPLRVVSCHLGGSASICAIKGGKSLDTSMGFSPQDGIINSTRNGAIDPFILPFIMDQESLTTDELREILASQSGLLGISGLSGDMRDLEAGIEKGNDRARLAVEAFCYGVKKEIGALTAAMGGIDVLAFAGGIGERSPGVRRRVCEGLDHLGILLDPTLNQAAPPEGDISYAAGATRILIIKTDEEIIVARAVRAFLDRHP